MTFSHHHAHARRDVDMTQGSITRHLIQFALPLLAGNVFQQLYNMVDTWVVGNFVSNEAFSAVGTVGPIVNMLIGFFMGLSSGAGVVISQYYGAHRPEKVRDTVHTAMVLTLVLCAAFTALGLALIPAMLDLMNTPAEVLPESTAYLSIYFSGITGLLIYNMGSGILRAVGDSRRPFYFLVVSAVLNTGLDLLFVIRFHMGVAGVAWATIIAQAVSAVLVLAVLMRCCRKPPAHERGADAPAPCRCRPYAPAESHRAGTAAKTARGRRAKSPRHRPPCNTWRRFRCSQTHSRSTER